MTYFIHFFLHTGVRVVQIVRHVRALSVWRGSAPSAVQTARSAPALQPQPSPAPHPANTPTGTISTNDSEKKLLQMLCFHFTLQQRYHLSHNHPYLTLIVCQMMNKRALVTRWIARPPRMPPATATVHSQTDASLLAAIRTSSPV